MCRKYVSTLGDAGETCIVLSFYIENLHYISLDIWNMKVNVQDIWQEFNLNDLLCEYTTSHYSICVGVRGIGYCCVLIYLDL